MEARGSVTLVLCFQGQVPAEPRCYVGIFPGYVPCGIETPLASRLWKEQKFSVSRKDVPEIRPVWLNARVGTVGKGSRINARDW